MTVGYVVRKGAEEIPIISFEIDKQTSRAINIVKVQIPREYNGSVIFNDDLTLGVYSADEVTFTNEFSGYVTTKRQENELNITIESYGSILNRINVADVYYNKSPESIVEEWVTNNTDLTYASTEVSGITIEKFKINDQTIAQGISELGKLLDWQIRTDNDRNLFYEPSGFTQSNAVLEVGVNCVLNGKWDEVPDRIINKIIFVGDNQRFNTQDLGTSVAGGTSFPLTYKPVGNVKVTLAGAELLGGVQEASGTFDYKWDSDNKVVIFTDTTGNGDPIIADYEYEIPVKITSTNDQSISDSGGVPKGVYSKKITNKSVKTMAEARDFSQTVLDKFSEAGLKGTLLAKNSLDVDVGQIITVKDDNNSVNQNAVIQQIKEKYPDGILDISVGSQDFEQFDWQDEIEGRLRQLEDEHDNSDLIQEYRSVQEELQVNLTRDVRANTLKVNSSWIWGKAVWGSDKWGDRRDGDSFQNYDGDYTFSNVWLASSGSANISNQKLLIEASANDLQTASFNGWKFVNDYSLSFDGVNESVNTNCDVDLSGSGAFSLFMWYKNGAASGSNYIASQTHALSPYGSDFILGYQNGGLWFRTKTIDGGSKIYDGGWHLTGLTFDGTTARLYIDGVEQGSGVTPVGFGGVGTVRLMTRGDGGTSFAGGKLDCVSIWDKVLTPAEVTELYGGGGVFDYTTHSAANNLIAWYKMGDGDNFIGPAPFIVNDVKNTYNGVTVNMESADKNTDSVPLISSLTSFLSLTDGQIKTKLERSSSAGTAAMAFRVNPSGTAFYYVAVDMAANSVCLKARTGGPSGTVLIGSADYTIGDNAFIRVYYDGNSFVIIGDDKTILELTDDTIGTAGFNAVGMQNGSVFFNNIKFLSGDDDV